MNGKIRCTMKSTIASVALMILVCAAPMARAQAKVAFDLPVQPLADSLRAVGSQTNINLLFDPPLVAGKKAPALKADVTADEALTRLLVGTGIKHEFLNETTIVLAKADAVGINSGRGGVSPSAASGDPGKDDPKEGQKSADSFRIAQVDQGATRSSTVTTTTETSASNPNGGPALTEIIVTAQKKSERLQDVPVPVTAIDAQSLADTNQLRIQDYYASIPGLSMTPSDTNGAPTLAIRGVTTGAYTNPSVGITVDDVPYGASTSLSGGSLAPDIDPSELASIEVLRGPQGTLYGASSIGGLLKFVTVDPSTDGFSGRLQASGSGVSNGDGLGYGFRGAVNVPVSDTFAFRASAFTRHDPGYVDNVQTGQNGVNWGDASGGRLSALWQPSQELSVKLGALLQNSEVHGSPEAEPTLGDLKQNTLRDTGEYDRHTQVYSATVKAKLGSVDLTAVSGYTINTLFDSFDITPAIGGPGSIIDVGYPGTGFNGFGVTGASELEHNKTTKFTQEIRLSVPLGQSIDWLIGGFYTHEHSLYDQQQFAANPTTGALVDSGADYNWGVTYAEYAAFTDVTFHVTDRFDVQVGGRESHNRQTYSEIDTGPLVALFEGLPPPVVSPEVVSSQNSFTYLLTPEFKVSSDLMLYARLASGYRPGGPNPTASALGLPVSFGADKTRNYEIGAKGDVLAHALSFDASVYYIDWKDIQLTVLSPNNLAYFANGSRAKSQGVELSVESRPLQGLKIAAWVAFNDAVLTEPMPPMSYLVGVTGDRLPYSSRFSSNLSLQQEFPLWTKTTGYVGGAVSYVGDRTGVFTPTSERQDLPAYAKTDLSAGARYESWTANLYVNNLADKRGVLAGGVGASINPLAFNYIPPRTVGLSVARTF